MEVYWRPEVGVYGTPASDSGQALNPELREDSGDVGRRELLSTKYPCMERAATDRERDERGARRKCDRDRVCSRCGDKCCVSGSELAITKARAGSGADEGTAD